ncbi:hypothetical protein [Saliniramus sp.]|uniref:hypothetical protein n=1 Tax=Saliniramus sp. TaxID=2986772 RepID=UPI002CEE8A13|nr:hypothetical protein [Saliniramus sp.]HMB10653.1 hypothetical protein [Saliniramus sp.]
MSDSQDFGDRDITRAAFDGPATSGITSSTGKPSLFEPRSATIVRFPGGSSGASAFRDQKSLMDAVYSAGSIPVSATDRATKRMAARLQVLGFFEINEVTGDGALRRLRPSEAILADEARPWRIAKPAFHAGIEDDAATLHA